MAKTVFRPVYGTALLMLAVSFLYGNVVFGNQSYTTVASNVSIVGDARDGTVISYDARSNTYHPSRAYADEMMYGVIVLDPVLLLRDSTTATESAAPVVRYGEAVVNVTTLGGDIRAGDHITTSVVEGYGQRVPRDDGTYVLGFALEDMTRSSDVVTVDGQAVEIGTVPVALRIGPYVSKQGAEYIASTAQGAGGGTTDSVGAEEGGVDAFKVFRYSLAALVAVLAVAVAARRFGETFSQSVVSIGRNPLARGQIRSMVIWNSFLIILISSVGFGISALILFLP